MDNEIVFQLSWPAVINLILEARNQVRLILPSVHPEWAALLEEVRKKGVDIKVCLSNTEKTIREGFGNEDAVKALLEMGIPVNESKSNRISMISVDNKHFVYFPTSRIFEDTTTDEGITNAISVDLVTATSILSSFFPEDLSVLRGSLSDSSFIINEAYQERLEDLKEDLSQGRINTQAKVFDKKKFDYIQAALKINPPVEPDLRRAIEVYNLKVQFVELRFENGKISGKRVRIPKKALPFESPELKNILDAGMKIFTDVSENKNRTFDLYISIQEEVKKLREKYLIPIKCRPEKSILIKLRKAEFQKAIDEINIKIKAEKLKLINDIDSEIEKAKNRLGKELLNFFLKNPPEEIKGYYFEDKAPSKIGNYVYDIIRKMKFPKAHEMVEEMRLNTHYYDLTWNDFSDKKLLREFEEKGILVEDINSIRQLSRAFEAKK